MMLLITASGCALFKPAEEEIIRLDERHDRHRAEKMNAMGIHWIETGRPALAQHSFEKALIADETYGPAHNNLGQVHYDAGDMYLAAVEFDAAAQFMPGNPIAINNLGLALETGGKVLEALEYYHRAHELDPTNEEFLGNLVRARMRLGEWDESLIVQLRELRFVETRPEWIDWIDEQLAIRFNPYLDRGPSGPEFSSLENGNVDETPPNDEPIPDDQQAVPDLYDNPFPPPVPPAGFPVPPGGFFPPTPRDERADIDDDIGQAFLDAPPDLPPASRRWQPTRIGGE